MISCKSFYYRIVTGGHDQDSGSCEGNLVGVRVPSFAPRHHQGGRRSHPWGIIPLMVSDLHIDDQAVESFCKRWKIRELALFGSVLRDDFHKDSDVDVLVTFQNDARWTLFDHVDMQDELASILGRRVDLVSRRGIEASRNSHRRSMILDSAEVIYASA